MSDRLPRVLIGSSSEGLATARRLSELLQNDAETQLWNDGFFTAGEFALETLETRAQAYDGAIVVGTADDLVTSRGTDFESIRDNVLLEFGMFVAMFGRRRALLALEGLGTVKVPSDLFGLTCVGFTRSSPPDEGLSTAVVELRRALGTFSLEVVEPEVALNIEKVLRAFMSELQSALGVSANVGFHVWVVDEGVDPPQLVRVARSRTSPRARLDKEFGEGEGIAGECWRTALPVAVDFNEEPYKSVTETTWNQFGAGVRKGMSFELLDQSRQRYRTVGATPLITEVSSGTKFLGCVSYNVGPNVDALAFKPDPLILEAVLDRSAEVIRVLLQSS